MSARIGKRPPYVIPGRRAVFSIYLCGVIVVGAAVALGAGRVPSLLLGAGTVLLLGGLGLVAARQLRRAGHDLTEWHDVMPCYLSIQDENLRIVRTNNLFRRDFGDLVGQYCHWAYKRSETPCPDCPVLATFQDGRIHTSEEKVTTRDGRRADVVVTSAPYHDDDGHLVGVIEMSTNVTEIKALQRELERTRTEYQRLFDLVPCYISVQDRDYRIVASNRMVERDFGPPLGKRCYEVYKRRDCLCRGCIVQKSFEDGGVYSSEETTTTRDGRTVRLISYSMPIRDGDGNIERVMEVATDITEVKRLEQELAVVGRAVAGLAHRIKNILMGLEGGLFVMDTALKADDEAEVQQGWEMIQRNVERVSHIVKDLLYCSKRREPEFKDDVSPEQIAREVHELFRERTAHEGIDLELEVGEPRRLRLEPSGIHSLITNLVTNAIDACRFDPDEGKERHRIAIRCGAGRDGGTRIEIEDDGAGIPADVADRLFTDFFSTKGTEGTGLGLLIIRRVVEGHGGTIDYDSAPGRGTIFRIELPAEPAAAGIGRPGDAEADPDLTRSL